MAKNSSLDYVYFVLSGGKTASMSISNAIVDSGSNVCAAHNYHYWDEKLRETHNKLTLDALLKENSLRHRVFIVTCYREPVSRAMSSFFQTFHMINDVELHHGNKTKLLDLPSFYVEDYSVETLYSLFLKYHESYAWRVHHSHPFVDARYGINVLQYPFNKQKGYIRIEDKNRIYLIIAFYALSRLEPEIRINLEIPELSIRPFNVTMEKTPDKFLEFKKYVMQDPHRRSMIRKLYEVPEMKLINHFYPGYERMRWLG